jgi:hypothetical protein
VRTFRLSAKGFEKNKKIKNPQAGPTASRCHHYPTATDLTAEEEEVALAMLDGHSHLQRHPAARRRCGAGGRLVKKDATVEVSSRMSTRCHRISHQGRKVTRDLVVGGGRHRQILSSWEEAEVPPPLPVGKNRERGGGDLAIVDLAAAVINPVVVDPEGGVAKLRGGPGLLHLGEPV